MFKHSLFCYMFIVTLTTNIVGSRESEDLPIVDALIHGLKEEVWNDDEGPCLEKWMSLLHNVKNFTLWATWVWDANKFPSGSFYGSWNQLGNFDQCMNPPWLETHPEFKTQYCLAEIQMTNKESLKRDFDPYGSTEVYLKTKTKLGLPVHRFTWGICAPALCQPGSLAKVVKRMYSVTHFKAISRSNITVEGCQVAGAKDEYTTGYYLFCLLIAAVLILSMVSTFYTMYNKSHTTRNHSIVAVILESFCLKRNSLELTKSYKDEITVLNGIRTIIAMNIVMLHIAGFTVGSGSVNTGDLNNKIPLMHKLLNLNVIVDSFFAMSGLLHVKNLLSNKQPNIAVILWKRYVRLIVLLAISIFYFTTAVKVNGPFAIKVHAKEVAVCQKNWLYTLLMINTSKDTICYPVAWYPACDYHLTVFATLLFCIYQKSKSFAIKIFGFAAVMSILIPGFLTYWYKLPSIFLLDLEDLIDVRAFGPLDYTYFKTYSRAGPYLAGMVMGYLMHVYKPTHYRHSLSKMCSILGTIFCLVLMVLNVCIGDFLLDRDYDALEAAVVAALYRTVWAVTVCGIVGFCEYGNVSFMKEFLSMPLFRPLGRLAYGMYMVHPLVIQHTYRVVLIKSPPVFNMFACLVDTVGVVTVSLGISYILWVILEAPTQKLSDRFICDRLKGIGGNRNIIQKGEPEPEKNEMKDETLKSKTT